MTVTVKLSLDATGFDVMLASLADAADLFPEIRQGLVSLLKSGEQLFGVDGDVIPASVTGELLVRLQPSDALLRFMSTSRAWDIDFSVLKHATSPVGVSDVNTTLESMQ